MGARSEKEEKIAEIFDEYIRGGLSGETTEIIQGWIAHGESAGEKETQLKQIWDRTVKYRPTPSPEAHAMYDRIRKKLDFPRESRRRRPLFRDVALRAAAVMVPILLAVGVYLAAEKYNKWNFGELVALSGQRLKAVLPDGTAVWLNGDTRLTSNGRRSVKLDGEAYFKVVNTGGRPFVVLSGSISVTVLGTEFSINANSRSKQAAVTLFKGKVKVGVASGNDYLLEPEQRLEYNSATGKTDIIGTPLRMPEWMGNSMIFEREPLENIFAALEKIFGVRFDYGPGFNEERLVTLKLRGNESLAETLFVLSKVGGNFTYAIDGNKITVSGL